MENDLIRRSDVLDLSYTHDTHDGWGIEAVDEESIMSIPAVDAVEAVRCMGCKHWETDWEPNHFNPDNPMYYCAETDLFPSGNWFCADAQRREDGDASSEEET